MSAAGDVLTLQEVAGYLKVHPNTVYRLARKGSMPAFKIGTDWRFHRAAIEEWMRTRRPDEAHSSSDDVFHLVFWLLAQGISLTATSEEIGGVLELAPRVVERQLRALVQLGYLSESQARFALTPEGLQEARRRYLRGRPPPAGHASVVAFASRQMSRG